MFNTSPIYFETFTKRKLMVKLRRVYLHDKRLTTIFLFAQFSLSAFYQELLDLSL